MNKVFVPQMPSRFDTSIRAWVPTVNMEPAKAYGELVVMLPPEANRLNIAPLVDMLKDKMQHFSETDYVVAVGDPSLLAAACCIAARRCGGLVRMLKWDRNAVDYIAVEFRV